MLIVDLTSAGMSSSPMLLVDAPPSKMRAQHFSILTWPPLEVSPVAIRDWRVERESFQAVGSGESIVCVVRCGWLPQVSLERSGSPEVNGARENNYALLLSTPC